MGKPAKRPTFDAAVTARLQAIGDYELAVEGGTCEIQFDNPLEALEGLPEFGVLLFLSAPGRSTPVPSEALFALWDRYQKSHHLLCDEYRRLLFSLFERSSQAKYDNRQWKMMGRSRPVLQDMTSVVSSAEIRLEQHQQAGKPVPECDIQLAFVVFWDEHGVALRLHESQGKFRLGEWTGIGDE